MTDQQPMVVARAITKRYPGVVALKEVDFEIRPGEVHVLVGENGAGKSTLVKVLAGVEVPDGGGLWFGGEPYAPQSPQDGIRSGVQVVYQELDLLPDLSVAENLHFQRLPRRAGLVDFRTLNRQSRELLARVGLDIPPRVKAGSLSVAQQRLVEIAKALSRRARLLILDEPTASLTQHEIDRLFDIIRQLREEGVSILYISHYLDEVFEIGDRVTVLRNGERVGTHRTADLDVPRLVQMMVGRDLVADQPFPEETRPGDEILRVEGLRSRAMAAPVSFSVREGELLGIAGLVGAGRTEAVRALFGADRAVAGSVTVAGRRVRIRRPRDAVRAGISLLTEDRKSQGLVLPMGSDVNITLAAIRRVASHGLLRREAEKTAAQRLVDALRIKTPSLRAPTRNLSGGNQQKVVLARWLYRDSRVLIVDEPTIGLDVGARREIYTVLARLAREGRGVVLVSSDMSELLAMCHRIIVFSRGRITGELTRDEFDRERILTLAYQGYLGKGSTGAGPSTGTTEPLAADHSS